METDLTSIIIGLASLAVFLVPIGYYQHQEKKSLKEAKKQFLKIAADVGFQASGVEILRNRAAIGLDVNHEQLLYVRGSQYEMIELTEVVECKMFRSHKKSSDNQSEVIQQIGLCLKIQKSLDIKLLFFEGKEGTLIGDEDITLQRWIESVNRARKELGSGFKV